ncbi:aldo/keto reductase [Rahnella sp. SAP-1]|jgi:aryl-alcohol dehydrogenase-like predicted oxidoreductase|uniref:Aldo/keto reductase n=1 Tax=Rouxiella aceris TaxID=2703884 RepID=A0A848MH67_9GAMM|nr:aldo/keto reductase [Rouxiella aceris]NMP26509.1 aldo/keto reductase [Rouxiella aceris]
MRTLKLGHSGLEVSAVCLGCLTYAPKEASGYSWSLDEAESRPFIRKALELGINFFDTANAYSKGVSEEILGRALKDYANRDNVVIATKLYNPMRSGPNSKGLSRKAIISECEASLRRLGTDYIDLYQIHRWDYDTPLEETLEALHDLVKAGKVRYLGASSMFAWQFSKALQVAKYHGWTRFICMQNHLNLLYREEEREMLGLCASEGVGVTPWSPLARGLLTRPWQQPSASGRSGNDAYSNKLYAASEEADRKVIDAVTTVARQRGVPQAQIALAWLYRHPSVVAPVVGATRFSHLEDALAATELVLEREEIQALEAPYIPHNVVEHE